MSNANDWRWGSPSHAIAAVKKLGGTPRQCRLFCVACCRLVGEQITHPDCRELVELVEAFADDPSLAPDVARLRRKVSRWATAIHPGATSHDDWAARWSAWAAADPKAVTPVTGFVSQPAFRDFLAEVYGPRSGAVAFSPAWRTENAVTLAAGMYASRDFAGLPVLADALEEAGCDSDAILGHCRGPGPHGRGCWVIDLILGKQ